ncbi:MAG: substrate-binding domain-containing protein [Phycisphaerae bacterium]|jgi:ribose transport system substrate-binding protein|nr:substrate-binding domain-containing protein [Phycisphaerae bacterium]
MLRSAHAIVVALGAILTLAACDNAKPAPTGTGSAPTPATQQTRIAVIPKGTSHEFWKSVQAGALKAGEELGVEVIWKGPAREDDRDDQIKVVEDFVTQKVNGIVIAPLDDTALVRPLEEAKDAGIRVTIIDSGLNWDGYESFAATDNSHGGELAGEELGRLLGGKGKVVMMRYVEGSASTRQREEGFLGVLKTRFPGIEVLSSDQYGGATLESCLKTAENLLTRFPEFDGAYAPNEPSAAAFMKAINDAKRKEKVKLVGFDASTALVDGLKAGAIDALVVQNPLRMGELGVKAMVDALGGKPVEKRIDTGCTLVTKASMDSPEAKEVLAPDLSRWIK